MKSSLLLVVFSIVGISYQVGAQKVQLELSTGLSINGPGPVYNDILGQIAYGGRSITFGGKRSGFYVPSPSGQVRLSYHLNRKFHVYLGAHLGQSGIKYYPAITEVSHPDSSVRFFRILKPDRSVTHFFPYYEAFVGFGNHRVYKNWIFRWRLDIGWRKHFAKEAGYTEYGNYEGDTIVNNIKIYESIFKVNTSVRNLISSTSLAVGYTLGKHSLGLEADYKLVFGKLPVNIQQVLWEGRSGFPFTTPYLDTRCFGIRLFYTYPLFSP